MAVGANVLAYGILEITFLVILVVLVGAAGLFGLYVLVQLFRNPAPRPDRYRWQKSPERS